MRLLDFQNFFIDWFTFRGFFHKEQTLNPNSQMPPVTTKEKEVLSLVAVGLTTKEIAEKLSISHHTVETHRKNLLRKCGAKNSAELVQKTISIISH